jgi:hypothetical protein
LSLWVNGTVSRFKFGDPKGHETSKGKKHKTTEAKKDERKLKYKEEKYGVSKENNED